MAVWVVRAAGDEAKVQEALKGGCCIAGWDGLSDFRRYNEDTLREAIAKKHPAKSNYGIGAWASQILRFRDEINSGDIVVMPAGRGQGVLHVGLVEGDYDYGPAVPGGRPRHKRPARWLGTLAKSAVATEAKGTIGAFLTVYRVQRPAFERQLQRIVGSVREGR